MAAQAPVPQLRPLGIGEILDVGIKITTRHWWTLARAVLVVVVPLQLLAAVVEVSAPSDTLTVDETGAIHTHQLWTLVAAGLVAVVLTLLAQTIATGACFKAVTDAYLGRVPSWRGSLATVLRRLHSILLISILIYVLGILAFFACVLPGIWLFVSWTVAVPAFLTEGVRGRKALGRSFRLVRGFWWRTLAVVALGSILGGILSAAIGGVLQAVTFSSDSQAVNALTDFVAAVVSGMITTPFIAAVTIVLYIDLRVRKEGFDLALLATRFGEGGGDADPFVPIPAPPPVAPRPMPQFRGSQPPFWPPPPGWKPDAEDT